MSEATQPELTRLRIEPQRKVRRKSGPLLFVLLLLVAAGAVVAVFVIKRQPQPKAPTISAPASVVVPQKSGDAVLAASGYIIPRERIEISPRFMGTVKWIGVKKGDSVKKGDVMVRLEDDEYRARVLEAQGRVALGEANLANAEANLKRQQELAANKVDSQRALDDARRARDAAIAEITTAKGALALVQTWLDWCTIRAPIDGTVLEKLAREAELVVPQSFGGTRGPSTALVSLADLSDLQVEIDLNEADTPKVHITQRCRVSPEAYPDKHYPGRVAEIAPEANRSKGTLQVKVQVEKPDKYLTPELTAKVEFLAD